MYKETLYINENEPTITSDKDIDESHSHNVEEKKPDTKEHTLYESIYMKLKKRQDYKKSQMVTLGGKYG